MSAAPATTSARGAVDDRHEVIAKVTALVLDALPNGAIDRIELSELINGFKPGPAAGRALLAYLETDPDALTSGKSDGPPIRLRLLEQLAERLPGVVELPRCVSCQRQVALFRKLDPGRC